ncbi:hypothetical protein [Rhodococcus marinonascens]|uniref:hypothetical protein n=1 Tax=Rhodococcus marinonascens TaxID=38311 RepID=UPI000AFCA6DD|nr:hypothetical protein [Rhodococcus marinonascens]
MQRLKTGLIAYLIAFTVFAAVLLAYNFTPTRAVIWGIAWLFLAVTIIRKELKKPQEKQ